MRTLFIDPTIWPTGLKFTSTACFGVLVASGDRLAGDHELQRHAERVGGVLAAPRPRSSRCATCGRACRSKLRLRTVSRRAGARGSSPSASGGTSASSTVSHSEPVHTPWAPRASAAAIWRPEPMPPAASTGVGATASITSGHSTIEPMSPVWPPPSVPWAMTMSTPASRWRRAWAAEPHSAATRRPASWISLDDLRRRRAEGVGDQAHLVVAERLVDERPAVASVQPSRAGASSSSGSSGTPWSASRTSLTNVAVLLGDHRGQLGLELVGVDLAHALVLAGDDDVDAVGLVGVLVDPVELDGELLGGEADGAEHAEAAGVGHGGDDVAAVGEGEDRELDAELVADLGAHARTVARTATRFTAAPAPSPSGED